MGESCAVFAVDYIDAAVIELCFLQFLVKGSFANVVLLDGCFWWRWDEGRAVCVESDLDEGREGFSVACLMII